MFLFCRGFKTLASHHGLHSASAPGILALDINVNNNSKILTGGSDKTATVFNKDDEQVLLDVNLFIAADNDLFGHCFSGGGNSKGSH